MCRYMESIRVSIWRCMGSECVQGCYRAVCSSNWHRIPHWEPQAVDQRGQFGDSSTHWQVSWLRTHWLAEVHIPVQMWLWSPVSSTRVDGPSWRVTGFHYRVLTGVRFHYPSWRPVNSASGNVRPSTQPVLTGNGNRSPVNSGRQLA